MKRTVYIETTVVSYLTARPSRDLIVAAHQQITLAWWDNALPRFEAFVSPVVLDETSKGDAEAVRTRLERISSFRLLEVTAEVKNLAGVYFKKLQIPEKARADSLHLALAAWHGLDYLVSWNCAHIVNGEVKLRI